MQRLDGAAPTTVSDSKWPNPFLDPTASGRSAMGTRIGMRGPFAFLPVCVQLVVAGLVTMIFRV